MKTLVSLVILSMLFCAALAVGQSSVNVYPALNEISYAYYGGGARAMAMGNAFVGLANDVNGGSWNPAGVWILDGAIVSASYNIFDPYGDYTNSLSPLKVADDVNMTAIGHASFVVPVRIKGHPFVFNFNYIRNNDRSVYTETSTASTRSKTDDRSYLRTYSPGLSTRVFKQLSLGLQMNIYDGARVRDVELINVYDTLVDPVRNIRLQLSSELTNLDSVAANGFNLTLGALYKMDKLSFGAVVRTPFKMKNNADNSRFTVVAVNGLPSVDASDTVYVVDSLSKQEIPLSLAFGIGFQPSEKLTFVLDANYQNYGSVNWYYLESTKITAGGDREDVYQPVAIDWNNTFGIGGGVEYVLETGIGRIPLRTGLRFDQLPESKNYTITTTYDLDQYNKLTGTYVTKYEAQDRQNEVLLSFGTGIHWSQLGIDITYRLRTGAEQNFTKIVNAKETNGNILPMSQLVEKIEDKTNELNISFIGRF